MIILTKAERDFVIGKYAKHAELNPILLKTGEYCLPDGIMLDIAFEEIHAFLNELPIRKITLADLYKDEEIQPKQAVEVLYNIDLGKFDNVEYFAEITHTPRVSKNMGFVEFDLVGKDKGVEKTRERKVLKIDGETEFDTPEGKKTDIELVLMMDEGGVSVKNIFTTVLPQRKDYIVKEKK
jgi:hypothetical protein